MTFSARDRSGMLDRAQSETFDLLVIGGGITGAGIALDAVSRGLTVCLIEKDDFASGTSGKSTKLIHGGLRYLKQFEFGLVKEVGQERAILHRLAPHIVIPEKMILPLIQGGSLGKTMTSIGLYIYDFLAEVQGDDKRKMLDKEEVLSIEPLLPDEKLLGGSIYAEYRTDDARLTLEVIKTAYRKGACTLSYLTCKSFIDKDGLVGGAVCVDGLSGDKVEIKARKTVNATGPWVDDLRSMNETVKGKRLYLTKGIHVVVARERLPVRHSIYFDVPTDNRMIFAIPRLGVTYIGTTDTYYEGDKDDISITDQDVTYLLNAVNLTFPKQQLAKADILSSWAGVRPLIYEDGKSASEISRKDETFESESGLISIAGGKLTGYRKMAERVVDLVVERLDGSRKYKACQTDKIPLTDPHFANQAEVLAFQNRIEELALSKGLPKLTGTYLTQNYGKVAQDLIDQMAQWTDLDPDLALLQAELEYCYAYEMLIDPADYLVRRSGRIYFLPDTVQRIKEPVINFVSDKRSWSAEQRQSASEKWDDLVHALCDFG